MASIKDRIDSIRDVVDPGLSLRIMESQGAGTPPPAPAAPPKRIGRAFQAEDPDLSLGKAIKPRPIGTAGRKLSKGRR